MRKKVGTSGFMQQQVKQDKHLCLFLKCSRFSDTVVIGVLSVKRHNCTVIQVVYTKLWDSREKNYFISLFIIVLNKQKKNPTSISYFHVRIWE